MKSKLTRCSTSSETTRLIREGEKEGRGVWRCREREIIYLSLHCHHLNDSCIKMGSDKSHFNVALIVRDKATRQCPQTTALEKKGEPKRYRTDVPLAYQPNALPLGHTGSYNCSHSDDSYDGT